MQTFVQYLLSGLSVGGVYALVALGFYIMWSAAKAVNFAYGDMLMMSAMGTVLTVELGVPLPAAIVAAIVVCIAFGLVLERFVVRPFNVDATSIGWMLTTIAVGTMVEALITAKMGAQSRVLPSPGVDRPVRILGAGVYPQELAIPLFAVAVMLALEWFYRHTLLGRAMRAVAFNRITAGLVGIDASRITAIAFGAAAALGAIAGILIAPVTQASASMGVLPGLKGFAVAIIAGIANARGVVIVGLAFGVVEKFIEGFISTAARDAIGFGLMILLLLLFPQGVFGRKEIAKV
jgi:branched-chain amino acid transport system permease protein